MSLPLVSCVTVARGSLPALKEAVRGYCEQTYARRELIVAAARDARYVRAVREFVSSLGRADIRVLALDDSRPGTTDITVDALRAASGDLVCIWADNERSHTARLQAHVDHLSTTGAGWSAMAERLVYLLPERLLYWVGADDASTSHVFGVADTLMARSDEAAEHWKRLAAGGGDSIPGEPHRLPADAAFLGVRVFGDLLDRQPRPDEPLLMRTSRDQRVCRAHAAHFRMALAHLRLPRPCLVRARSDTGEMVTVEIDR